MHRVQRPRTYLAKAHLPSSGGWVRIRVRFRVGLGLIAVKLGSRLETRYVGVLDVSTSCLPPRTTSCVAIAICNRGQEVSGLPCEGVFFRAPGRQKENVPLGNSFPPPPSCLLSWIAESRSASRCHLMQGLARVFRSSWRACSRHSRTPTTRRGGGRRLLGKT